MCDILCTIVLRQYMYKTNHVLKSQPGGGHVIYSGHLLKAHVLFLMTCITPTVVIPTLYILYPTSTHTHTDRVISDVFFDERKMKINPDSLTLLGGTFYFLH